MADYGINIKGGTADKAFSGSNTINTYVNPTGELNLNDLILAATQGSVNNGGWNMGPNTGAFGPTIIPNQSPVDTGGATVAYSASGSANISGLVLIVIAGIAIWFLVHK